MRFFNSVKALYSAVGVLFLIFVLGYYLDIQKEAMNARHLEISTSLEKMIRLEQELTSMLSLAVVERNELRVTRYETVRQDVEASIKKVIDFTKDRGLAQEVAALTDGEKKNRGIEEIVLQRMRSDRWKEARGILFGDEYLSAKKTYEIDSEAIPGIVQGEIEAIEKRFNRISSAALYARIGALCLLVWTGFIFSKKTRADLAEQMRLQKKISDVNEALEERVRERTSELESTLQKINASEEALRQAAQEQAAIFESLSVGIAFIKDRIILRGNAKLGELFGRSLDEMVGQTTRIWYESEEEYSGIGASTYEDLKRQPIHQREQELPRKDGSLFWCLFRVRAVDPQDISQGIVCTLEDITERKEMEQKLRLSNFLSDQALDLSKAGHWHIPLNTGDEYYNSSERAAAIFGDPPRKDWHYHLMNEWFANVEAGDKTAAEATFKNYGEALAGTVPQYDSIYAYKRPIDGRVVWIHAMGHVVRDADGKPTDMYGVTMDITERKQAEVELNKRMEELERFMRLTINREKQMIQLKEEINLLLGEADKEQKYKIVA